MSEVWIPATPLPYQGLLFKRCGCGQRFRSHEKYERHWHAEHASPKDGTSRDGQSTMGVSRERARQLGYRPLRESAPPEQARVPVPPSPKGAE